MSVDLAERLRQRVDEALRGEGSWLGLGFEEVPGRPFGWAHAEERRLIREHLKARGRWRDARDEFTVSRIQARLHRTHPTYRDRQEAWRRRCSAQSAPSTAFIREELERLVELFTGANDPVTASIAAKAAAQLRGSR